MINSLFQFDEVTYVELKH